MKAYLSHARAITPIRDPIHGYIRTTVFEKEIIDSPYFQRLHFVLQNSTTYVAYPSNKNSRFAHSLGVAHLAGELFRYALMQSSASDLYSFLSDCEDFIHDMFIFPQESVFNSGEKYINDLKSGWSETIRGRSQFAHCPFLSDERPPVATDSMLDGGKGIFSIGFLAETIWQSIRISGLVHDIGHLPMSHSLEEALKRTPVLFELYSTDNQRAIRYTDIESGAIRGVDQASDDSIISKYSRIIKEYFGVNEDDIKDFVQSLEVHERRSLGILNRINENARYDYGNNMQTYRNVVLQISFLTLFASIVDSMIKKSGEKAQKFAKFSPFLRVLKTIVAGEIDADRMDYTIRDGYSCGTSIGNFDLERVTKNAILVKHDADYRISFYERAVSGIEQFFAQRHDGYKYLIYHRTSSRSEACLQELVSRLLHFSFVYPTSVITDVLQSYGFLHRLQGDEITDVVPMTEEFLEQLDDCSLRSAFFQIIGIMKSEEFENLVSRDRYDDELVWPIFALLEIFLFREYANIYNPFKIEGLSSRMRRLKGEDYSEVEFGRVVNRLISRKVRDHYTVKLKKAVKEKFCGAVVTVSSYQFPKTFRNSGVSNADKIFIINSRKILQEVTECSNFLKNMHYIDKQEMKIRIYFVSKDIKNDDKLVNELEEFLDFILLSYYEEISAQLERSQ